MHRSTLEPELDSASEAIVLEFEKSRRAGQAFDLVNALQYVDAKQRPRLAAELACIDLELCCDEGRLPVISQIVWQHSDFFESESARAVVAVEHFRLCCVIGTSITRDAIAKLYNVSTQALPERTSTQASSKRVKNIDFPNVGDTFCNYPLIAELGRGSLARVYLALQPDLAQRLVVLKVTPRETSEADKLARLQHTGIIPVYSIHKQGELTCICMPYLGALTLANLIDDGRLLLPQHDTPLGLVSTIVSNRLSTLVEEVESVSDASTPKPHSQFTPPLAETTRGQVASVGSTTIPAAQLSAQLGTAELVDSLNQRFVVPGPIAATVDMAISIVDALAYAHKRSIVHRDLKPENILIANDGQPILLDLNLAAAVHESDSEITGGTLPYMSAQQLRSLSNNGQACASDDVFSVGVLLYQLLSGKLPFEPTPFAIQDLEKVAANRAKPPASLRTINAAIPASLASIVSKCLAYEARDRYSSAAELLDDLSRFRSNQVLRYAADRSPSERIRKWVRRHPVITSTSTLFIGFGIALIATVSALMLSRTRAGQLLATQEARALPVQVGSAISLLQTPGREPELLDEGIFAGKQIVTKWLLDDTGGMRLKPIINQLDKVHAEEVKHQLQILLRMMASASAELSKAEPIGRDSRLADISRFNLSAEVAAPKHGTSSAADYPQDVFSQALDARDQKKFTLWEELCEKMVSEQPSDPAQWFSLGAARWTLGKFDAARHAFDVAEKLQPNSPLALFWKGVCEMHSGNANAAKANFSGCLETRPDWMPALYNRALAARMLGEHAEALVDLARIANLGQATTRVYSLQSQLYRLTGEESAAKESQALAMDAVPHDADDWATRGLLQLPSDTSAALRDFEKALELNPTNTAALQNMAHIQSEITHENQLAVETLTQLTNLRPKSATPIASRGIVLGRMGQFEKALSDAKSAEMLTPNAMEMLQIAGIYSLSSAKVNDRRTSAISWLAKAIAIDSRLRNLAASDPDLENLREMEQFRMLTLGRPE